MQLFASFQTLFGGYSSSLPLCVVILVLLCTCKSSNSSEEVHGGMADDAVTMDTATSEKDAPAMAEEIGGGLSGGSEAKPIQGQQIGTLLPKEVVAYYKGTADLSGEPLRNKLHQIIRGHSKFTYGEVYDILEELDADPAKPGHVLCLYSGFSMNADKQYDGGNGWNREHIWAKSYGDFGTAPGPGTDLHHLRATDISTNEARNNRAFDEAEEPYIDQEGAYQGNTPSKFSRQQWTWEPPDQVKGDIARMMFYMDVRYEGGNNEPDLQLVDEIPQRNSKAPLHGKLSTLLNWHRQDPVDAVERNRNNLIFKKYQQNRNPFIDHPEFADRIWGGGI